MYIFKAGRVAPSSIYVSFQEKLYVSLFIVAARQENVLKPIKSAGKLSHGWKDSTHNRGGIRPL